MSQGGPRCKRCRQWYYTGLAINWVKTMYCVLIAVVVQHSRHSNLKHDRFRWHIINRLQVAALCVVTAVNCTAISFLLFSLHLPAIVPNKRVKPLPCFSAGATTHMSLGASFTISTAVVGRWPPICLQVLANVTLMMMTVSVFKRWWVILCLEFSVIASRILYIYTVHSC